MHRTLGMPIHTQLKQHDNTAVSMDVHGTDKQQINYMQQINKITPPFYDILALCYFGECWAGPGMLTKPNKY